MISSNTLSAKDTFTEVPDNKRVCLFQTSIVRHGIKVGFADTQFSGNLPQLASVSLAAYNT
jgi:hypothetical protein